MKTFVLHDESLNSYGFWMLTAGADLSQFSKNPIMLFNHNRTWRGTEDEVLPIGHWENIRIEGDKILADAAFDSDEFSQKIAKKVEEGTLRMASMGVKCIEESEDPKYIKPGQRYATVLKWKAREASVVDIGANDNALAMYDADDKLISLSADGASIPLKQLKSQNNTEMKQVASLLKLKEGATEEEVIAAIKPLQNMESENQTLKADLQAEQGKTAELQGKLDAIELKEKEAKTAKATELVGAALKDGRISDNEKGDVKAFWLGSFEANYDGSEKALAALPKRKTAKDELKDQGEQGESVWAKRQKEIEENSKSK